MTSSQDKKANNICWSRLIYITLSIILAIIVAVFFPYDNIQELTRITNRVTPVLFGFTLSIIAIIGSIDTSLKSLSADALQLYKESYKNGIIRICLLGSLYLILLILGIILSISLPVSLWIKWIQYIFVFITTFSLLFSLAFPKILYSLYVERYELMLENKNK